MANRFSQMEKTLTRIEGHTSRLPALEERLERMSEILTEIRMAIERGQSALIRLPYSELEAKVNVRNIYEDRTEIEIFYNKI